MTVGQSVSRSVGHCALALVAAAAPLRAQARGVELFQLMGREALTKTTGNGRLQWIPGGGYLESSTDSATGGRLFSRVDPVSQKRSRGTDICMVEGGFNNHLAAFGLMGTVIRRNWSMQNVSASE